MALVGLQATFQYLFECPVEALETSVRLWMVRGSFHLPDLNLKQKQLCKLTEEFRTTVGQQFVRKTKLSKFLNQTPHYFKGSVILQWVVMGSEVKDRQYEVTPRCTSLHGPNYVYRDS